MRLTPYRSGFEHLVALDLEARGIQFSYEKLVLGFKSRVVNGVCSECGCGKVHQSRTYTPDFVIPREGKPDLIVEAKGILDGPTRSKMRDVLRDNPDRDIRLLFDGKPTWKRSQGMIKWCNKFHFTYAFGHVVPEEWLT